MNPRFLSRGLSWPLLLWQSEQRRRSKGKGEQSARRWKGYSANPGRQHQLWDAAGRRRLEGEVTHLKNSPPHLSGLTLKKLECRLTEGWPPQSRERILVSNFGCWKFESNSAWPNHICRIWSHLWVHGSISHCYSARDGKVTITHVWSHWWHFSSKLYFPAQVAQCWRCVQPGLRLCRYHTCLQVYQFISCHEWGSRLVSQYWELHPPERSWKMGKSQHPCCYFSFSSGWTKRTWHSHLW